MPANIKITEMKHIAHLKESLKMKRISKIISESEFHMQMRLLEDAETDVTNLITKVSNYDEFVSKLGTLASDPKVQAFIKSGRADGDTSDDALTAVSKGILVSELRPTQNEIDLDKSLKFPLTNAQSLANCLGSGTITIKGPIVTYNGKFVIDGHHRWSQLYAVNATAKIDCVDLSGPDMDPVDVLKIVQLGIASELGKVPSAEVDGKNLLEIGIDEVRKYVIDNITADCISTFKKFRSKVSNIVTAEGVADGIIIPNVEKMRKTSQPVTGAPSRNVMPQTDDAVNVMKNISKGIINYNEPYSQTESVNKKLDSMLNETIIKIK